MSMLSICEIRQYQEHMKIFVMSKYETSKLTWVQYPLSKDNMENTVPSKDFSKFASTKTY